MMKTTMGFVLFVEEAEKVENVELIVKMAINTQALRLGFAPHFLSEALQQQTLAVMMLE